MFGTIRKNGKFVKTTRFLIFVFFILAVGLRIVHLHADTPLYLGEASLGLYVDEGYKTLDARNLMLFGQTKWDQRDQYVGWSMFAPLVVHMTAWMFQIAGPNLGAARVLSVGAFACFLGLFVFTHRRRYDALTLLLTTAALSTCHGLFFISRLALFETFMILAFYGALFGLRHPYSQGWVSFLWLGFIGVLSAFGIKGSALAYFGFALVGVGATCIVHRQLRLRTGILAGLFLACSGLGAVFTLPAFLGFTFSIPKWSTVLAGPLSVSHGFWMASGFLAIPVLLCCSEKTLFKTSYQAALLGVVVLGVPCISLLSYAPLRYYLPLLPAYVLLCGEAIHVLRTHGESSVTLKKPWLAAVFLGWAVVAVCATTWSQSTVGEQGWRPFSRALSWLLAGGFTVGWLCCFVYFKTLPWRRLWMAILTVALMRDVYALGQHFFFPSFEGETIRSALQKVAVPGSAVAGDWAPFFTLGTNLRSLYSTQGWNNAEHLLVLQPTYFLSSGTDDNQRVENVLRDSGVLFGAPTELGSYARHTVRLYRLDYPREP